MRPPPMNIFTSNLMPLLPNYLGMPMLPEAQFICCPASQIWVRAKASAPTLASKGLSRTAIQPLEILTSRTVCVKWKSFALGSCS